MITNSTLLHSYNQLNSQSKSALNSLLAEDLDKTLHGSSPN